MRVPLSLNSVMEDVDSVMRNPTTLQQRPSAFRERLPPTVEEQQPQPEERQQAPLPQRPLEPNSSPEFARAMLTALPAAAVSTVANVQVLLLLRNVMEAADSVVRNQMISQPRRAEVSEGFTSNARQNS